MILVLHTCWKLNIWKCFFLFIQKSHALSTLEGYSGYGAEQGEKVCYSDIFEKFFIFCLLFTIVYDARKIERHP